MGEACGLTDTRSGDCRGPNHSEVMIDTIDADEAWWPPTFIPGGLGRTRLAWWMIAVDTHSTWRSIWASASRRAPACMGSAVSTCA